MHSNSGEGSNSARRARGAVRAGWIVVLAAAAVLVALSLYFSASKTDSGYPTVTPGAPDVPTSAAPEVSSARADARARASDTQSARAHDADEARQFQGRGRIRGEIAPAEHVVLPKSWTLVLEPHPYLSGSELAERKRIDFTHEERAFDVGDLQLGGYNVRAEALGFNSSEAGVILVRSSADVFVTIVLSRAGIVDGRVLDSKGAPAESVPVMLEARRGGVRRGVQTAPDGGYVFRDVVDGAYILYVGAPESPLVLPGEIVFKAPSLRFQDVTLPATGSLVLHTRDEFGQPAGPCDITGFGTPHGALETRTRDDGEGSASWLVPGKYRLEGRLADGRTGRSTVEVGAGEPTDVVLVMRP